MTPGFRMDAFPHVPVEQWRPATASGRIARAYLHWSGGDYATVYDSYHLCIAYHAGRPVVVETRDLESNMRDLSSSRAPYAAHVAGRNSYAAGIAVMAMRDARPDDFGAFPITTELIDALCLVAARLLATHGVSISRDTLATHAEAAVDDGYFGANPIEERWDIARLTPSDQPLQAQEALHTGDALRERAQLLYALERTP